MRRLLCLILALATLAGNLPAAVLAEENSPAEASVASESAETTDSQETVPGETEPGLTDPEPAETADTEEKQETSAPEPEPAVSETAETLSDTEETPDSETTEAAVPGAQEASADIRQPMEMQWEESCLDLNGVLGEPDTLLDGYLDGILYGNGRISFMGVAGRDRLDAPSQQLYDALSQMIREVAEGSRHFTRFENLPAVYSAEQLGVDSLWEGKTISREASDRIFLEFREVLLAVLEDFPYECYWIDKRYGIRFGFNYTPKYSSDPRYEEIDLNCSFEFPVSSSYADRSGAMGYKNVYYIETVPNSSRMSVVARSAAERARKLVFRYDSLGDWDKLHAYKEFICNAVKYDQSAARTGPNDANGSQAWQMISVFDEDPTTNVVCEGYSKAFQYLCDLSTFENDVTCYQDVGMMRFGSSGGLHMWNVVELNGQKLLADLTNSDEGSVGEKGGLFLVSVEHIPGGFQAMNLRYTDCRYLPDDEPAYIAAEKKEPTCEGKGMKPHFKGSDGNYYIEKEGKMQRVDASQLEIAPLGHDFAATYQWSEDGSSCTAVGVCRNDASHRVQETVKTSRHVITAPTCEKPGKANLTAEFEAAWAAPQKKSGAEVPALGHDYSVEYDWSADGKSCVARAVCKRDKTHKAEETGKITSEITLAPGCLTKGKTTYTAAFKADWAETQQKTVEDLDAVGHDWIVTYQWSEDGKSCTAVRVCGRDTRHNISEDASISSAVSAPADCEHMGRTIYTASFGSAWAETQKKIAEDIPALGHDYIVEYNWSEDGKSCTATAKCSRNPEHVQTAAAEISSRITVKPTRNELGEAVYSAVFKESWAKPQQKTLRNVEYRPEHLLTFTDPELMSRSSLCIDGISYPVQKSGEEAFVELPDDNCRSLVLYTYHEGTAGDPHTQYPTGMQVWILSNEGGQYTAKRVPELDDLLIYAGSSIRLAGKKGIRMITGVKTDKKNALAGEGLAGYKLLEYGTALAWSDDLTAGHQLVLGDSTTRSNHAYKRGVSDPVFRYHNGETQYTNVLVGFSSDDCKKDLAMRSYILLEDAWGNQIPIYGGTVFRSIGYIACQNRKAFPADSAAYDYVWDIIHHVYGSQFDADFKG